MSVKECLVDVELRENVFLDTIFRDPAKLRNDVVDAALNENDVEGQELVFDEENFFFEDEDNLISL